MTRRRWELSQQQATCTKPGCLGLYPLFCVKKRGQRTLCVLRTRNHGSDLEPVLQCVLCSPFLTWEPSWLSRSVLASSPTIHLIHQEPEDHGLSCLNAVPLWHPGLQQRDTLPQEKRKKTERKCTGGTLISHMFFSGVILLGPRTILPSVNITRMIGNC